ncbi:MAG: APC family permease [Pirellulales bacterium]
MTEPKKPEHRLRSFDATALVVGSMIGSGIFLALPIMARGVPSPAILIGLWIFGGLFTVLGANCCAELAAMLPKAGGQYVFIREAFGDLAAFLFGWTYFLIIQTGTNAIVAIAFAKYLGSFVPGCGESDILATIHLDQVLPALAAHLPAGLAQFQINSAQLVACIVIALLTAVNIRGLREGVWVQNLFTVLKLVALAALIVAGLWYGVRSPQFIPPAPSAAAGMVLSTAFLAGLAVALSKAMFAYDAWYTVTFVAEEVHQSNRTVPRSLLLGTVVVTVVYVLANLAYLAVLPLDQITGVADDRVAEAAGTVLFGKLGATAVIVGVLISTFGCLNGLILGGARLCYAMAREGLFLRSCATLHPRRGTPATALWYQGIVSIALTFTGSYSALLTYTMFASIFFMGLMVAAVYRLRVKYPELPRPYRCWGYPLTPAAYLLICALFLIYTIAGEPLSSGIGVLLMLSGIPFYAIWRLRAKRLASATVPAADAAVAEGTTLP